MTHKQESGRTVLETIAVLTIAAVLLITSIGGIAFLIQRNNRKQSIKEIASMVTALKTSNVLRKYDTGAKIPVREVVQGPKASDAHNEVMILSEGKDSFMIVTAWGNNEFVADVQVQPGTCSEVLEALGQDEISVAVFEEKDRVDTADEFSPPISWDKGSVQFQKLDSDYIDLCNKTGIFAFKMGNPAYLYDDSLHLCPKGKLEDVEGNCCDITPKVCGTLCSCPSGQHCKDRKVCVDCLSDSDCDAKHICKDNKCQEVDCTQNNHCTSPDAPICNTDRYECESCPDEKPNWNNGQCVECLSDSQCDAKHICKDNKCQAVGCTQNSDCPPNTPICNSEYECESCPDNQPAWNGTACVTCAKADSTKPAWTGTSCVECTKDENCFGGKVCNTENNTCVECAEDSDCTGGKACDTTTNTCSCPTDKPKWNGTACESCPTETPVWNSTKGKCEACPSGTPVWNSTKGKCEPCTGNKPNWNESTSSCVECLKDENCSGGQECNTENTCACPEGEHWNGTSCVECIGNSQCPEKRTCVENMCLCDIGFGENSGVVGGCMACRSGWVATIPGEVCTECKSETIYPETSDGITCSTWVGMPNLKTLRYQGTITTKEENISGVNISVQYYNPTDFEWSQMRKHCPPGSYIQFHGLPYDCQRCPIGYFGLEGTNYCTAVPEGTYWTGGSLKKCPAGTFNTLAKASGCVDCAPGKISGEMDTSCQNCPAGTYANGTKTINGMSGFGSTSCEECPNGTYSVEGSSKCVPCNGELQYTNRTKSACYTCPFGQKANTTHTGCVNQN